MNEQLQIKVREGINIDIKAAFSLQKEETTCRTAVTRRIGC